MRVFDHDLSEKILVYKTPPTWISVVRLGKFFGIVLPVDETFCKKKILMGLYREEETAAEQVGRFKKFCASESPGDFFFERESLPAVTALEFARDLTQVN